MEFGFVVMRQQGLRLAACTLIVACAFICQRQVVGVFVIVGLEFAGALKIRDSLTCLATHCQQLAKTMVRVKIAWGALYALSQCLFAFGGGAQTGSGRGLSQGGGLFRDRFAGAHNCVGTVTAEVCGVGNSGDRELRLVKELRLSRSSGLRCRSLCFLQREIDVLPFFRAKKECRHFGVSVTG